VVVLADAEASAGVVDYCDDKHGNDAYSDARYGKHGHDVVPVDATLQVDGVVRADAVVAVRMQISLISGIYMRKCIFS
jgi:hypothetical protein